MSEKLDFGGAVATVTDKRIRIPQSVIDFMGIENHDVLVFDFDEDNATMKICLLRELLEK